MTDRYGDWIQTFSGTCFWPLDPRPEDIRIYDIAHALSNLCRFTGHCKSFYSVAQHSVLASLICKPEHAKQALLHDAAEAYFADMSRPIKHMDELQAYRDGELKLQRMILSEYGLPDKLTEDIHVADNIMLGIEIKSLMQNPNAHWRTDWVSKIPVDCPVQIIERCWLPEEAEDRFIVRYFELFEDIKTHNANA